MHLLAVQPDQPESWLIEKISNFYNLVIFNQRLMKLVTLVLPEVLNQIISTLLAQPTKKESYRDFSKKPKKWDNFWTRWDINLIFCVDLYYIH